MDVSVAIRALKSAADVYGNAKKIPEQKQILEGLAVIAVLQQDKFDLEEKVRNLKKRINKLEDNINKVNDLKFSDESYWVLDENNQRKDGPFCMSCFDASQRKQRLTKGNEGYYHCPACKNAFIVDRQEHDRSIQELNQQNDSQHWQSY